MRKMIYLVNQKRKKQKGKRKNCETQENSDYEIIQEPIILLTDIFYQFWPLRPKLRVQEQREDPSHLARNKYGEHWAIYATYVKRFCTHTLF